MKAIDFSYFIERYNAGEMSDAEKLWFGKELEGNENLRKEVNLRRRTDEVLNNKNIISLRNKLSDIEKMRTARIPVKSTKKPVYLKSCNNYSSTGYCRKPDNIHGKVCYE